MRKKILFAVAACVVCATAWAAQDLIIGTELQTGSGTNGMTRAAPSLVTDGVPVQLSTFSATPHPVADFAQVLIQASPGNNFTSQACAATAACDVLQCWHMAPQPDGGGISTSWSRCPAYDLVVDGGASGLASAWGNTIEFPTVGPLPIEQPGNRYDWACVNCQQTGTLDAGVNVMVRMVTAPY